MATAQSAVRSGDSLREPVVDPVRDGADAGAVTPAPPAVPARRAARSSRILRLAGPPLLSVALLAVALPALLHVDWPSIGSALTSADPRALLGLTALWLLGLWVHTLALSAAMPGLSHRRALVLNLSGSSVSNLVPLGGAAGTLANFAMSRSWGFTPAAFARWALVTNIWDTLAKLLLPLVAVAWVARSGLPGSDVVGGAALWAGAGLVVVGGSAYVLLQRDSAAAFVGRLADSLARRLRRPCGTQGGYADQAVHLRREADTLVRRAWGRLTLGKLAYAVAQALLLGACLWVVEARPSAAVVFAAFAVERVLSVLVITPGATGFTELGVAGVLVAMGVGPVEAAAGVVLYRAFTFGMEIPVGGAMLLWWRLRTKVSVA